LFGGVGAFFRGLVGGPLPPDPLLKPKLAGLVGPRLVGGWWLLCLAPWKNCEYLRPRVQGRVSVFSGLRMFSKVKDSLLISVGTSFTGLALSILLKHFRVSMSHFPSSILHLPHPYCIHRTQSCKSKSRSNSGIWKVTFSISYFPEELPTKECWPKSYFSKNRGGQIGGQIAST